MPSSNLQILRSRIGKVCVAIIGTSPAELIDKASAAVRETPFLEFRLDYLQDPAAAMPKIKEFLDVHNASIVIATCRRTENGGKFDGSVTAELDVLTKAAQCGCQIVDVELETAEALARSGPKDGLDKLRESGVSLIVSHHNFESTRDLDKIFQRIQAFKPDFIKIVPTARTLSDNVTLMRFVERVSDQADIIALCMGDAGIISRVLGLRAGSIFTFAAATPGEETGPGQIAARTLVETYRIEEVDAATKVYGVAGNPAGKSLSPIMLNTAFRRETVNAVYLALQTAEVADLVALLREIPISGVSVTMPHKQTIMPYLEHTDPLSRKIGACNTILRGPDGNLYGFNTDVAGIVSPLEKRMPLNGARVLVLGAGGSARAAVFGLRDKGAEVFILNRTPETAAKLAKQSGAKVFKRELLTHKTNPVSFDIIINSTPVGMSGNSAEPLLTEDELRTRLVFDLVYNPVDTPLIRMARAKGIPVITGVEMFVQQGARQFEIWTGKPAPEEEMLRVVVHALRQQAEAAGELRSTPTPEPPLPAAAPQPEAARPVTGNAPAKPAPASRPSVKAPAKAAKSPAKSKK